MNKGKIIILLTSILLVIFIIGIVAILNGNKEEDKDTCPEVEIPLKLKDMKIGDNNITLTYLWEKDNLKNLTIYKTYFDLYDKNLKTSPKMLNEFILYKGDIVEITHNAEYVSSPFMYQELNNFKYWYGKHYIYLKNPQDNCQYIYSGGFME